VHFIITFFVKKRKHPAFHALTIVNVQDVFKGFAA